MVRYYSVLFDGDNIYNMEKMMWNFRPMETKTITDNEFLKRLRALIFVIQISFLRPNYYDPDKRWGFAPCKNWEITETSSLCQSYVL